MLHQSERKDDFQDSDVSDASENDIVDAWDHTWDAFEAAYKLAEERELMASEEDSEEVFSDQRTLKGLGSPASATIPFEEQSNMDDDLVIPSSDEADKQSKKFHIHHVSCLTTTKMLVKFNAVAGLINYEV